MTDALCLNLAFILAYSWATSYGLANAEEAMSSNYFSLWTMYNLVALVVSLLLQLYSDKTMEHIEYVFRATFRTTITFLLIFTGFAWIGHPFTGIGWFLAAVSSFVVLYGVLSRFFLTYIYTNLPKRFNWYKRIALIGHDDYLGSVAGAFSRQHAFFSVDTIPYRDPVSETSREEKLARFKRYFEEVSKAGIHDVFLISSPDITDVSKELILAADHECVQLNFVPAMTASISYGSGRQDALTMQLPVLKSHEEPMSTMENRIKKRLVDLLISSVVILFILSWMIPIIGIIIKIQSPGPIFFRQPRSGRNNKSFGCYKFRSMVVNKDSHAKQASKDDKRITPIGKFLRKTNLDEFPQFINVFLGQMSVVGPRPHMLSHTEHYSQLIQHYMVRHFVKPGITGWAQVNGYRGETKDPGLMAKRVEYDLEYLSNWSAMLDFKIVCMTAINMLRGEKNAY
ncbi:exopolysaccharide biosynthesis polyprenyl glycosylphosphotransferase [Sphingobacterium suaedae]